MRARTRFIRGLVLVIAGLALAGATPLARDLIFHVVPIGWTGEAERLVAALNIHAGQTVADVGAGSGALIAELAAVVGPQGTAYATERTPEQRAAIAARGSAAGHRVTVLEAPDLTTNLPTACCHGIVLRMVLHHIADPRVYATDLARALRDDGRLAIIDFLPGALPHLAGDHGVSPDDVVAAFHDAGLELHSRDDDWGGRSFLLVFRRALR